jgi:hypothetical protein
MFTAKAVATPVPSPVMSDKATAELEIRTKSDPFHAISALTPVATVTPVVAAPLMMTDPVPALMTMYAFV